MTRDSTDSQDDSKPKQKKNKLKKQSTTSIENKKKKDGKSNENKNKKSVSTTNPVKKARKPSKKKAEIKPRPQHMDLDYWHGLLPKEDTANLVKEDGQYLLRKDLEDANGPVLLSVRCGNQVINAVIDEKPSGFSVSDREFDSVDALISYYQVRKVPIKLDGVDVILGVPVRRKAWELRHKMITIQQELGAGSYGVVYMAQLHFPRQEPITVAAKSLTDIDLEAQQALWKEARSMQLYDHENITKFYGVCNDQLPYYLVMEFIRGGSVDSLLTNFPGASHHRRARIALEAACGIDYLHSKGCIHRDIAARNLLIDKVTKVADFGLTRKCTHYKIDPDKPMNLRWLAPDVYKTSSVTKATDVYAFGITLFELFVVPYAIPYSHWDTDTVFRKVVEHGYRLAPPQNCPKEIGGVLKDCLLEPKLRPTFKMIVIFLTGHVRKLEKDVIIEEELKEEAKALKKAKLKKKKEEEEEKKEEARRKKEEDSG